MPDSGDLNGSGSSTACNVLRVTEEGMTARADAVATEEPLEIQLSYEKTGGLRVTKSVAVTMRTPGHDAELAAGFLFGEGILREPGQIEQISAPPPAEGRTARGSVIRVALRAGVEVDLRSLDRNFYTTSSCGVCGKTSLEALRLTGRIALPSDEPVLDLSAILRLPKILRETQTVFDQTGGLHAAGLFDAAGTLIGVHEDVGRHNAVDKVIGAQFLAGRTPLLHHVLLVSGRASFELMQKALTAGVPVLAAVGAPSSLAVELARQFGATLFGFVRDGRLNVYAGAHRLRETAATLSRARG
ncbi:MAG TPA: formate dehydrogenase accessory sulfurtransferase FdhD [Candidatus Didemnitutus sp.]|nr:formate dehydrogenase accessory sulfurtransferase FdhD [Candidatus Didemnitutus sp.]